MIRVTLDLPTVADVTELADLLDTAAARAHRFCEYEQAEVWWGNAKAIREGLDVLDQLYAPSVTR